MKTSLNKIRKSGSDVTCNDLYHDTISGVGPSYCGIAMVLFILRTHQEVEN